MLAHVIPRHPKRDGCSQRASEDGAAGWEVGVGCNVSVNEPLSEHAHEQGGFEGTGVHSRAVSYCSEIVVSGWGSAAGVAHVAQPRLHRGLANALLPTIGRTTTTVDVFGADQEDMAVSIYADAVYVESDKEGRIMLPDALMQHAGLTDTVLFMGLGRTFQVWEPQAGQRYMAEARERARTRRLTLPGAPQAVPA